MVTSCAPTYESKGDKAYKAAQKMTGDAKRRLQKEAYLYYKKALKAHPNKVSNRLRNRFVEMTLERAELVLTEGSHDMGAIPLFMEDLDSSLSPEVNPEFKSKYAQFLALLADSNFANQKIYKGIRFLDKALKIAPDPSTIEAKRDKVVENLAKDNYEMAKMEYEGGLGKKGKEEDTEALIRAEYHTKLALYYDEDYPEAGELLSKLYQKNLNRYSAYEAVVDDKPDSNIYDAVNKYDILLAVTDVKKGGSVTVKGTIYNYSYNPLRLQPSSFTLVDENGNSYTATGSSRIDRDILDQEHETKFVLVFRKPSAPIKKLEYKWKEHHTEKNFF
jgi:hypothetical protein